MVAKTIYFVIVLEYVNVMAILFPRQENILSPIIDPAIDAVGKWVAEPVIDGVVTGVRALKDFATDDSNPSSFLDPSTEPSPEEGQSTFKLEIHQNTENTQTPTNRIHTKSEECDSTPNNNNPVNCRKTNPVIVFPTECASPRNEEITTLLTEWVTTGGFWISRSNACGGVIFWSVARLTNDQSQQLRAMIDVVSSIEPDGVSRPHGVLKTQESIKYNAKPIVERNLEKRDDVSIQRDAKPDLAYVSNPEGSSKVQPDYYHLTNAGEGITIYLLEQGVEEVPELMQNSVIQRWLFANDALRRNTDDSLSGHGTCVASKISGLRYGTIKRGTIVNVKMNGDSIFHSGRRTEFVPFASLVDAMQQVLNDLQDRTDRGEEVEGFTVVNLSYGCPDGSNLAVTLRSHIRTLIEQYRVVFVTTAGNLDSSSSDEITDLPAIMSPTHDIIVVGSINIQNDDLDPDSCRGPQMTITAPGDVICSSKMGTDWEASGTSVAAGAVTGVIAGFMSGAWGKMIRESGQSMPKAAKEYIIQKGLKRNWNRPGPWIRKTVSLWNGLDPDLEPPLYGWTPI